jgi:hypothetical protein
VSKSLARAAAGYAPLAEGKPDEVADIEAKRLVHYFHELPRECQLDVLALTEALWRRRRAEGKAEKASKSGKRATKTLEPGREKPDRKTKAS